MDPQLEPNETIQVYSSRYSYVTNETPNDSLNATSNTDKTGSSEKSPLIASKNRESAGTIRLVVSPMTRLSIDNKLKLHDEHKALRSTRRVIGNALTSLNSSQADPDNLNSTVDRSIIIGESGDPDYDDNQEQYELVELTAKKSDESLEIIVDRSTSTYTMNQDDENSLSPIKGRHSYEIEDGIMPLPDSDNEDMDGNTKYNSSKAIEGMSICSSGE